MPHGYPPKSPEAPWGQFFCEEISFFSPQIRKARPTMQAANREVERCTRSGAVFSKAGHIQIPRCRILSLELPRTEIWFNCPPTAWGPRTQTGEARKLLNVPAQPGLYDERRPLKRGSFEIWRRHPDAQTMKEAFCVRNKQTKKS